MRSKTHLCFNGIILMILGKKKLVPNFVVFRSVLKKLQCFESGASDVIPTHLQNILAMVFLHIFVNFMEKELSTKFCGCFDHFSSQVTKLHNMHHMLIVVYIETF